MFSPVFDHRFISRFRILILKIHDFFADVTPLQDRLDTVEEVTEPASSDFFADSLPPDVDLISSAESANNGGFQPDSLPRDHGMNTH
jgi:hypothetical protein